MALYTSNRFCTGSSGSQTSVRTLVTTTWLLFNLLAVKCAASFLVSESVRNDVSSRRLSAEDVSASSPETDNVDILWGRDVSPDLSTTSAPFSALDGNDEAKPLLTGQKLSLRSSSYNVSGIGGYRIYTLPIFSSELTELLKTAQADLRSQTNHVFDLSYHVNTTKWSFIVVSANKTFHYAAIRSVVSRFIKLSPKTAAPEDLVTTRVGVLFDGTEAVADITIMPHSTITNSSYIPFSNFGHHQPPKPQPEEIIRLTPEGSTCAYEVVNETAALAPFMRHGSLMTTTTQDLTPRSLETEMMMRISDTVYLATIKLWRRRDGLPIEAKIWAFRALFYIASWQIMCGAGVFNTPSLAYFSSGGPFISESGFDTGFYAVGRMLARFTLKDTSTVKSPTVKSPLLAKISLWLDFLEALLEALDKLDANATTWALEGELYLPAGNTTSMGNGTQEKGEGGGGGGGGELGPKAVAQWQVWLGDSDEHDDL